MPVYILGLDIGSTTSKAVILDESQSIVAQAVVVAFVGVNGGDLAVTQVLEQSQLSPEDISCTVATGYGRNSYQGADYAVSELSCHALGVHHQFPQVGTVIDIGGQDAKVLSINSDGRLDRFIMNDKCAAGTGRFLDVMAHILQLDISQLEVQAALSTKEVRISSTCTVFAESEVISQLSSGCSVPDVVAGICESVASRTAGLVKRLSIKPLVVMSGGVAQNGGVRLALERLLQTPIAYNDKAQLMGALGAAIYGYQKLQKT